MNDYENAQPAGALPGRSAMPIFVIQNGRNSFFFPVAGENFR